MSTDRMHTDLDHLIEEKALAKFWGIRLQTFREKTRYSGAPHYRIGRTTLYHGQELFDWMATHLRVGSRTS